MGGLNPKGIAMPDFQEENLTFNFKLKGTRQ